MRAAATASMVSSARTNRAVRQNIEAQNAQASAAPAPVAQDPVAAPAAAAQSDINAQLVELNNLKNQGILTEEEFAAKKKQLLGI